MSGIDRYKASLMLGAFLLLVSLAPLIIDYIYGENILSVFKGYELFLTLLFAGVIPIAIILYLFLGPSTKKNAIFS